MAFEELSARLAGVVATAVTPFTSDGALDEAAHTALLERLAVAGVPAIEVNGHAGEFDALSAGEAARVLEVATGVARPRAAVLCGVGRDVSTAAAAARHARDAGADAVSVHPPAPHAGPGAGWIAYHAAIASAVPEIGVVVRLADERLSGTLLARLGERCPNVVGAVCDVADPVWFGSFARDAGLERFVWLTGGGELTAPAHAVLGARGFTSALATVRPDLALAVQTALVKGDLPEAVRLWEVVRPFEELRARGGAAVVKEALTAQGLCHRTVRPPHAPLSRAEQSSVWSLLSAW
jgi:4-hydroxy-tetrahydrodipicolinate synthase